MSDSQGNTRLLGVPFAQVPIWLLGSQSVSDGAKVVWGYLAWRQGPHAGCWPSIGRMARDLGKSEDTVARHLKELEDSGYIAVARVAGKSNRYDVFAQPKQAALDLTSSLQGELETTRKNAGGAPPADVRVPAEMQGDPPQNCGTTTRKTAGQNDRKEPSSGNHSGTGLEKQKDWEALWREVKADLQLQLTKATFDAWVRGLSARWAGDHLELICRNAYQQDWVQNRLAPTVQRTVKSFVHQDVRVEYVLPEAKPEQPPAVRAPPPTWLPIPEEILSGLRAKLLATAPRGLSPGLDQVRIERRDHSVRMICPDVAVQRHIYACALPGGLRCDLQNTFGRGVQIEVITRRHV